ncbi:MAG: hypothetical protein AAF199_04415, partial [Pseudomonadota bacterium]
MSADPGFLAQRVLYRDGLMLIVDKPAGYAVHAKPGEAPNRSVLEYYFGALRFGLPQAPALAHRLDRALTGVAHVDLERRQDRADRIT